MSSNSRYPLGSHQLHPPPRSSYYDLLGVDQSACPKEIEKAYKRQALIHHPDRNRSDSQSESTEKFQKLIEAYDVLKDPSKRKKYDLKIAVAAGLESFSASREAPSRKPASRDAAPRDERVPPMRANSTTGTSYARFTDAGVHAKRRSTSDIFGDLFGDAFSDPAKASRYPSGQTRPASTVPSPRPPKPTVVTSASGPYVSPYVKSPSAAKRPPAQVPTFYPRTRQPTPPPPPPLTAQSPLRTSPCEMDPPDVRLRERRHSTSRPPSASPPRNVPDPYQRFDRAWGQSLDELVAGLNLGTRSASRGPDDSLRQGPRSTTRAAEDSLRQGPRSTTRAAEESLRQGPRSSTRAAEEAPRPVPRTTSRLPEEGQLPRPVHRAATMREDGRSERRARSSSTTGLHRDSPVRASSEWYGRPLYATQHAQVPPAETLEQERIRRRRTVYQSPLSASVGSPSSSYGLGAGGSVCSTPTTSVEDSMPSPRPGSRSRSATLDGGVSGGGAQPGVKREFKEVVYRYEMAGDGQTRVSREVRSRTVELDGTIRDRYRRQRAAVVG